MIRGERVVHLTPTSFLTRKWGERFAKRMANRSPRGPESFSPGSSCSHLSMSSPKLHCCTRTETSRLREKKPSVLSSISYDRFRNDVKSPPRFDQSIRNNWKFTRSEVPSKGNYFRARLLFDSGYQVSRYFLRYFEIKIRIRNERRDL